MIELRRSSKTKKVLPFTKSWLRIGLTYLVPIAFAVTVPAEALTSRLTVETLAIATVFAAVLVLVTRWIWRTGLRQYSGASA